jgi:nitrogen-specific signal transduction histidine kinase
VALKTLATHRKDGSEIDLTPSKSLMEAHPCKILFTSKKGKTTFILSFIS